MPLRARRAPGDGLEPALLSAENDSKCPWSLPSPSCSYWRIWGTQNAVVGKLRVREGRLATPAWETYACPLSPGPGPAGSSSED